MRWQLLTRIGRERRNPTKPPHTAICICRAVCKKPFSTFHHNKYHCHQRRLLEGQSSGIHPVSLRQSKCSSAEGCYNIRSSMTRFGRRVCLKCGVSSSVRYYSLTSVLMWPYNLDMQPCVRCTCRFLVLVLTDAIAQMSAKSPAKGGCK